MKRILLMVALTACGGLFTAGAVTADAMHYTFPSNIALELKQVDSTHVDAAIETRTGSPSGIRLFFESSDDLQVAPASASIERLSAAMPGKFRLLVGHTGRPTDESGSWIRLRAVYNPDYDSLAKAVANINVYPDDTERQKLLDILERNKAAAAVQTDAARLDMKKNPVGGK